MMTDIYNKRESIVHTLYHTAYSNYLRGSFFSLWSGFNSPMANQIVPSSSFSSTPSWTYDVFLSFRGEDTRTNFTDHLYHALDRHGINTFIDHCELRSGEEISPSLLKAIRESRISVIIFSEKYASSSWCLDELVHILECRKSKGQMTRPIFYKVDPSDVRHQKNSYGAAFVDHSRKYENDLDKVQRWRTALTEAANLKGATLNEGEYETTFINGIVEEISTQISNRTYLHAAKYPVGIESCVKEVEELLGVGGNDRRVVGIWGTSGIGKTTIAKAVHYAIAHKFQGSCFLANVRETLASLGGVIKLQKTLLSEILCGTKLEIVDGHEGISNIKNRLSQKKILLILDDVDKLEQLKDWVDIDCFGEGSRVIITTKDRSLLDFYGGKWIYEVQKLGYDKALELFSRNVFERNRPPDDYLSLARHAIAYAQGLPLALNIIGSYLRNKSISRWQVVLNSYDSYGGEPYTDIQIILKKTYDAWDYDLQQVFLDIACFFKGENKDYVLQILISSTLNVRQDCIEVLVEKAIITIEDNRILMHDLLEKMGKDIVYEESPTEPGKRSRLWHHEDVCNVLIDGRGTKKIRGIVVNLPKPNVIPLKAKSFSKMVNLEYFINRNAHFSGRVNYLPNSLRLIEFGGHSNIDQRHTYVPSNFHPRELVCFDQKHTYELNLQSTFHPRHLVKFDVSSSGIRQLKRLKNLAKLTWMNLSGCEFLEKFPDLSGSPNIKHMNLSGCKNLVEVDDSIGLLDNLVKLDLSGCSNLTRFATRLGLTSLEELNLCGCTRLERFPEIVKDKMKSLTHLKIQESGIRELPSSIANLTGLRALSANGCELQNVPDLSRSPNIRELDLSDCTSLVEVDNSVGFLDKHKGVDYLPNSLRLIEFGGRSNIDQRHTYVPSNFHPRDLVSCDVSNSDIRQLKGFKNLTKLTSITLSGCKFLEKIPDFSRSPNIRVLDLSDCKSLVEVDDSVGFLDKLEELDLSGCSKLTRFATRLGLRSLFYLSLGGCTRLERFPEIEKDKMKSLTHLEIGLSGIKELPSSIAYLTGLWELSANGCEVQNVPDLSGSPNLELLDLSDCKRLREIQLLPPKLIKLYLDGCTSLEKIPKLPPTLEVLSIKGCNLSESDFLVPLDRISKVVNLKTLYLRDCKRLREIPALPPKLLLLHLDGCTSLDKIPKLPSSLEALTLCNCSGLSGDEVAKLENNLLNEEIYPHTQSSVINPPSTIYPGNEVPKWFSYTSNHPTTIQPLLEYEEDEYELDEDDSEFRFEIPLKLQVGKTLFGLALSFVVEPSTCYSHHEPWTRYYSVKCILINEKKTFERYLYYHYQDLKATHVSVTIVGLGEQEQREDICQVVFRPFHKGCPIKSCGVQCLWRNQDEPPHLSLRPRSSLGKRPRPCGSSDIVDDEYDQQQQWLSSSSKPADDHPKRRKIDLNVPFDIEEDEEQE